MAGIGNGYHLAVKEALEGLTLSACEDGHADGPTFVVEEGLDLVSGTLKVTGPLCTADDVASMLDQLTSLAALGMQEVTLELSAVSSISESARDAMLELAVEASPSWLTVRLEGWPL
jgi:hypothetical protein